MNPFDRRRFFQGVLVTTVLAGCGEETETEPTPDPPSEDPADQARVFPHGLASGDPTEESIVLWLRVEPEDEEGPFEAVVDLASDEEFSTIVASAKISVSSESDFTAHARMTGLSPYTRYFYRVTARGVRSPVARTKTAPSPDQDVSPRFAFASCQDFIGRYYHAWKALADEPEVDFVLFLGDYIYETNGDPDFQEVSADRTIVIEEGIQLLPEENPAVKAAKTLADYRGIYKQIRRDPDLQAIHMRYPFICIWDDHEFANDCWQDHATDFNDAEGDEKSPERRAAATRAWLEFQPTSLGQASDGEGAPTAPLEIFRSVRYGKHLHLVLTDQRSYRDDHVIPEGSGPDDKPEGAPKEVPTYSAVGRLSLFKNSEVFSRSFVIKEGFDAIEAYVAPTMLGADQKAWLISTLKDSPATWKVWGNETQLAQMMLDLTPFDIPESFKAIYYFTVDQWDGFRTERRAILEALSGVENLVALTGDIHAFYASEVHADPLDKTGKPALVEYVTAGISSSPCQEIAQTTVDSNPAFSALAPLVPQFDDVLKSTSPDYQYAKSLSHGVAIATVSEAAFEVEFLQIADVKSKTFVAPTRVKFRTDSGASKVVPVS